MGIFKINDNDEEKDYNANNRLSIIIVLSLLTRNDSVWNTITANYQI